MMESTKLTTTALALTSLACLLVAGYRIVRLDDPFIPANDSGGGGESGWWLIVATRPAP